MRAQVQTTERVCESAAWLVLCVGGSLRFELVLPRLLTRGSAALARGHRKVASILVGEPCQPPVVMPSLPVKDGAKSCPPG